MNCAYCGEPIDPAAPTTLQRVIAWERKGLGALRKSGSDVVLREHREEYLHGRHVEEIRLGINPRQESLL